MQNDYKIGELIQARIKIDDLIKNAIETMDDRLKPEKRKLEVLDGYILTAINGTEDQKNIRSDSGTAFKEKKESFTVKDKMRFLQWAASNNRYDLLDIKVHVPTAKKYLEKSNGVLPDGLGYGSFILVRFRRNSAINNPK